MSFLCPMSATHRIFTSLQKWVLSMLMVITIIYHLVYKMWEGAVCKLISYVCIIYNAVWLWQFIFGISRIYWHLSVFLKKNKIWETSCRSVLNGGLGLRSGVWVKNTIWQPRSCLAEMSTSFIIFFNVPKHWLFSF